MKNTQKQVLMNDVLTGLLVAAAFAAVVPSDAMAQLSAVGTATQTSIMHPFVQFSSYIAYGLGTVLTVAGIANAKKHADDPRSNPLAPALGKLGAGGALLAAPTVAGMLTSTATDSGLGGNAAFTPIGG